MKGKTAMTVTTGGLESVFSDKYFPAEKVIPSALVFTHTTVGGHIEGDTPSLNVPYVSSTPAAEIVAEGNEIPENDGAISVLPIHTRKVAVLNAITNEASLDDGIKNILSQGMLRAVIAKADAVFLQNPTPDTGQAGVTGLFNIPGIPIAGNIEDSLDPLIDAIASISGHNGTPTNIIMGYGTWAKLLKLRLADGAPQISPDVANAPTPVLFGVPVTLNAQTPDDKIIVTDRSEIISAAGDITAASSGERYFERDTSAMRATFRFGFGVIHPDRLAIVTTNTK